MEGAGAGAAAAKDAESSSEGSAPAPTTNPTTTEKEPTKPGAGGTGEVKGAERPGAGPTSASVPVKEKMASQGPIYRGGGGGRGGAGNIEFARQMAEKRRRDTERKAQGEDEGAKLLVARQKIDQVLKETTLTSPAKALLPLPKEDEETS